MRAVWRHDVFITRVIRQKNGIGTLYTLRTRRGLGDAVLTLENLLQTSSTCSPTFAPSLCRGEEARCTLLEAGDGDEYGMSTIARG